MPALEVLLLSENDFTGPFNHVVAGSPSLSSLNLASTRVSEVLSVEWPPVGGSNLTYLDLSGNPNVTGTVPAGQPRQGLRSLFSGFGMLGLPDLNLSPPSPAGLSRRLHHQVCCPSASAPSCCVGLAYRGSSPSLSTHQ